MKHTQRRNDHTINIPNNPTMDLLLDKGYLVGFLHDEIVHCILEYNEWISCGAWARTCKYWMKKLTSPNIVAAILGQKSGIIIEDLPKWLFYALPVSFIGDAPEHFYWDTYQSKRTNGIYLPENKEQGVCYFYTGGDVSKHLYDRKWVSDLDIWTNDLHVKVSPEHKNPVQNRENRRNGYIQVNDLMDIVIKPDRSIPLQRCIETFDISLVQNGFLATGSSYISPQFYCTPLSVYSYRHHQLLIGIHPLIDLSYGCTIDTEEGDLGYTDKDVELLVKGEVKVIKGDVDLTVKLIQEWIMEHSNRGHNPTIRLTDYSRSLRKASDGSTGVNSPSYIDEQFEINSFFENCELCMATIMEQQDDNWDDSHTSSDNVNTYLLSDHLPPDPIKKIIRWNARIMKYRNRFPDFKPIYIVNPLINTT